MKLEKVIYTAKTHTTGGREGASRTSDGHLEVKLSSPGIGTGTNPEQLLAAGWSACFLSAVKLVASQQKVALPPTAAIDAEAPPPPSLQGLMDKETRCAVLPAEVGAIADYIRTTLGSTLGAKAGA